MRGRGGKWGKVEGERTKGGRERRRDGVKEREKVEEGGEEGVWERESRREECVEGERGSRREG